MHTFEEKLSFVENAISALVRKNDYNEIIIEDDWVQVTTPLSPTTNLNGVLKCSLRKEVAEERILKTINHYTLLRLPFRFKISPSSLPVNLDQILLKFNMEKKETLFGLYADPNNLNVPKNPDVAIKLLNSSILEDWLKVQAEAWLVPAPGIEYLRNRLSKALEGHRENEFDFLAYVNQKPVASASVIMLNGYAFLVGAAVIPGERKKGIYSTLLAHRLDIIKERKLAAVIHCLEKTSAPICLKLGFEKICEIYQFESKVI